MLGWVTESSGDVFGLLSGDGGSVVMTSQTFYCRSFAVILIFQIWKLSGPVRTGQVVDSEFDMSRCNGVDPQPGDFGNSEKNFLSVQWNTRGERKFC